jgi:hypothetical protein
MFSDEIKEGLRAFNIRADPHNAAELRKEIKERLAPLHPDSNPDGHFADDQQEEDFHRLVGLLKRIDKETRASTQLAVTNAHELSGPVSSAAEPSVVSVPPRLIETPRLHTRRMYAVPRITAALLVPVIAGLIAFIGDFKNNPLYQNVVDYLIEEDKANASRWLTVQAEELFKVRSQIVGRALVFPELGVISRGAPDKKLLKIYVNVFSPEEPHILRDLKQKAADLEGRISTLRTKDTSALAGELRKAARKEPWIRGLYDEYAGEKRLPAGENPMSVSPEEASPEQLRGQEEFTKWYLDKLQSDAGMFSYRVEATQRDFLSLKETMIGDANWVITKILLVFLVIFVLAYILLWGRERSDERWLEYLSSEDGMDFVFRRFCSNRRRRSRDPAIFSAREFTRAISAKDVKPIMAPFVGRRLDVKPLGQISAFLLDKLKEKGLIEEVESSTISTQYKLKSVSPGTPDR